MEVIHTIDHGTVIVPHFYVDNNKILKEEWGRKYEENLSYEVNVFYSAIEGVFDRNNTMLVNGFIWWYTGMRDDFDAICHMKWEKFEKSKYFPWLKQILESKYDYEEYSNNKLKELL